jgi:hypothetical protein
LSLKKRKKKFIANNLHDFLIEKNPQKNKKREKKSSPIIYLHDFLIEKTQKKREKNNCQ